jgi:hypothetical protein
MTVTGGEHATYVEITCEHGTTGAPVPNDDALTRVMDQVQLDHRHATGCDCDRLLAVLDAVQVIQ